MRHGNNCRAPRGFAVTTHTVGDIARLTLSPAPIVRRTADTDELVSIPLVKIELENTVQVVAAVVNDEDGPDDDITGAENATREMLPAVTLNEPLVDITNLVSIEELLEFEPPQNGVVPDPCPAALAA